jgi:hypothetical protein
MVDQQFSPDEDSSRGYAAPDGISRRHLEGFAVGLLRGFVPLVILGALLVAALLGVFGGQPNPVVTTAANGARLTIKAPRVLRNGVFFEIRMTVEASRPIARPVIAISDSYLKDLTINTVLPDPASEGSEEGLLTLSYGAMKPGDRSAVKIDGQINPPLVGRNAGSIAIRDGRQVLVRRPVSLKVFP